MEIHFLEWLNENLILTWDFARQKGSNGSRTSSFLLHQSKALAEYFRTVPSFRETDKNWLWKNYVKFHVEYVPVATVKFQSLDHEAILQRSNSGAF